MKNTLLAVAFGLMASVAYAETHEFNVTAVEIQGAKFWLPSQFTVKKGDTVIFHLVSKIPGANNIHGFAIDAFKVEALVNDKGLVKSSSPEIKFVADKEGIFKIRCHLHPAHVGGQLVVLP